MNKFILLLSCLVISLEMNAQVVTYDNAKKKAQKAFDDAQMSVSEDRLEDAVLYLKDALKTEPNFVDAYGQLTVTYAALKQYQNVVNSFETLKQLDSTAIRSTLMSYAKGLAGLGKFKEALAATELYLKLTKNPSDKAQQAKVNYTWAAKAAEHPVPFKPRNLGDGVNTKDPEYFPSLTIDGLTLVFTRRVNNKNEDFYYSERDEEDTTWLPAVSMGAPVNSPEYNEGAQNISQDGNMIVFTGCDFPHGRGSCDIYYSIRTEEGLWVEPMNIGAPINTRDWESQPSLSADKQDLYFARETQDAGADIFVSHMQENGKWGVPERLGPNINTPGRETTPFIHPDNQTLYFASSGHEGFGDMDLYYSRRQPDGSWGPAVNLGYPINTVDEEASMIVAADGKTAYFASDRSDSKGSLDIYSFELYPEARPFKTLYVKGHVYDTKTKRRLVTNIELTDLTTGKKVATIRSDKLGQYLIPLPTGKDYSFNVNRPGYLFYSDNFSLVQNSQDTAFTRNIGLHPIDTNAILVMHNVFFDSKQYELKPTSFEELNRLVELLNDNPTITVEVGGHTDDVGYDQDNMVLSQHRAQAVVSYLVSKGIDAKRLVAKGYGETKPIAENTTEAGRAKNRRTEMKVLTLGTEGAAAPADSTAQPAAPVQQPAAKPAAKTGAKPKAKKN
jgi:outer membrane protein OmpA-like peptidoglycan-associated protein/tetratricopeptide (TPR) repeat protein